MASLPPTLLENLRPRVLAIRKQRDEGWAIDELLADIEQRFDLLRRVEQQDESAKFYRLSARLESALTRLTALREQLRQRQREVATSVIRLESKLADEALAYLSATHNIRLGEVHILPTGERVRLEEVEFDEGYEPPKAFLVGHRLRKNGELGAKQRLPSLVYDARETRETLR
ncbi:hypothetical protein [Burkholderia pyrrocinia]